MLDFNYLSIFWWLCDPPNRANQSRFLKNGFWRIFLPANKFTCALAQSLSLQTKMILDIKKFHHYNWSLNWNVCNLTSHLLNRKDHSKQGRLKQSWNCFHIIESNLTMKKEFQCEPILCKHVLTFEWLHSYCIIHFPCFNIQKLYKFGSFKGRHTIVEIL